MMLLAKDLNLGLRRTVCFDGSKSGKSFKIKESNYVFRACAATIDQSTSSLLSSFCGTGFWTDPVSRYLWNLFMVYLWDLLILKSAIFTLY